MKGIKSRKAKDKLVAIYMIICLLFQHSSGVRGHEQQSWGDYSGKLWGKECSYFFTGSSRGSLFHTQGSIHCGQSTLRTRNHRLVLESFFKNKKFIAFIIGIYSWPLCLSLSLSFSVSLWQHTCGSQRIVGFSPFFLWELNHSGSFSLWSSSGKPTHQEALGFHRP